MDMRSMLFDLFFFSTICLICFRFHCPKCSNSWASAKAMAILYHPNPNQPRGKVTLRLFGQQCRRCSRVNDYFVDPEFEDDSIRLTLDKLYNKFKWVYYGEERPKRAERRDDRPNKIEGPHKKELCEACRMGCCEQARATKTY